MQSTSEAFQMHEFLAITKALSDGSRVRAVVALRGRELCVCQIVDLLGLAPSTVSKHLELLLQAGLVLRRKEGRWHFYRLPGNDAPPHVTAALSWALTALEGTPTIEDDAGRLAILQAKDLEEVAACYRG